MSKFAYVKFKFNIHEKDIQIDDTGGKGDEISFSTYDEAVSGIKNAINATGIDHDSKLKNYPAMVVEVSDHGNPRKATIRGIKLPGEEEVIKVSQNK